MTRDEIWLEAVAKAETETMPEHYAGYKAGYFDAALSRETEIATLRARVEELIDAANVLLGNDEYDTDWPQYQARVREAIKTFEIPLPETKVNASQQGV